MSLSSQIITTGAYGRNEFAYMQKRKARDALAQIVLTCIYIFTNGCKIARYSSDGSGALTKSIQKKTFE